MNERITENIVRTLLREKGYYDDINILIEEQKSQNAKIDKLLKNASKSGNGIGKPEFIISFKNNPDDLIIIECKSSVAYHESKNREQYKDYAVDGVLLYASYLSKEFNVTAIAVSGENEKDKKISTFLWLKQHYIYKEIQNKIFLKSSEIEKIIKEQLKPFAEEELIAKAIEYNSFLHSYSIPEVERCTLISAILIALQNEPFLKSYKYYVSNKELIIALLSACESVLNKNDLDLEKRQVIISEYSKFKNNKDFNSDIIYNKKTKKDEVNKILRDFIMSINQDILPHINESEFDVLGKFYTQFIRYAGSDKKTGLVLTPSHITDFFCDIAELNVDDVVFDPCCGTAGFLVSAMNYMLKKAKNDTRKQTQIKLNQLLGIEKRPDMFSHACSNMMMRGDGKSHILYGNCFDEENKEIIKKSKPTKGFLNPPYQDGNADEQLEFIENTLECLVKDGVCIAICQMSTIVSEKNKVIQVKRRLYEKHTLEAVFSMPNDLFYPIGANTCILVFKAHNPHSSSKKTFFGYFKDDGFIKIKNNGRIDKNYNFENIKKIWIETYINKESIPGLSKMQVVKAEDEWCVEAYMETDYSNLKKENFIKTIKNYVSFLFSSGQIDSAENKRCHTTQIRLDPKSWKIFYYDDIFEIYCGYYNKKPEEIKNGNIPFIGATERNNGVTSMHDIDVIKQTSKDGSDNNHEILKKIFKGEEYITISNNGSVGCAFYQPINFTCSHDVNPVKLKNMKLNKYIAMFLCTLIELEKYRWAFGRKWRPSRMIKSQIRLPITPEGNPDWEYMENYIKSLSYSFSL